MEFYQHLYIGETVKKRIGKIKKNLKKNSFQPFIHVITLPVFGDGQLEIYPAYILRQSFFREQSLFVVGIAGGREEAFALVQQIVDECLAATKDADLRNYLKI
jgi:hypothetical protein